MKRYRIELRQEQDRSWTAELLNSGGGFIASATAAWPENAARRVARDHIEVDE